MPGCRHLPAAQPAASARACCCALHLQDFGWDWRSNKLAYSCSTMVAPKASASTRRLMSEEEQHGHGHGHSHHHYGHGHGHGHGHGLGNRRLQGLPQAEPLGAHQRALLQLVQGNLDDPTTYPTNATTGLPLLHSRPTATRKIFLDFDGHTAV